MKWSAVALLLVSPSLAQEPVYREIRLSGAGAPPEVLAPFDHVSRGADGLLVAVATDDDLARLDAAGIPYEVVVPDLKKKYRDQLASTLGIGAIPPFGFGSMGGYYTFAEVEAKLDLLAAQWPNLVSPKFSIGSSLEGRPLWVIKVSDNPGIDEGEPEVWFDSLHHAREPEGMMALFHFLAWLLQNHGVDPLATHLVDEREIYFLPVVNPDGYVWNETTDPGGGGMWRKNRRPNGDGTFGVDLNRNYGFQWGIDNTGSSPNTNSETYRGTAPFSEP
ncbi:MAG TPA: M14 family metallopeptidase, partial [Planctomycetota bacterium]|nr:M14 family metallopeptidase [Planctomycetota bacterium]